MSDDDEIQQSSPVPQIPPKPAGMRPDDLPALFWDEMPEDENHPDLVAINALIEESTPEERAFTFKEQGNRALKTGLKQRKKFFLRQSIEQYTEGINLQCSDAKLHAILFSNRAHVNLLLGNYRNALIDAQDAIRFDPGNIKAHFRAAKAAMNIEQYDKCRELCAAGLTVEPDNVELETLHQEADAKQKATEAAHAAEVARQYNLRAPARELADAVLGRGWKIGRPQFGVGDRKPKLGEDGEIRWPLLLFYPEASMQTDAIEDFGELDPIAAHLDVMFSIDAPPLQWDDDRLYTRDTIELYYLSYSAKPIEREALTEALHGGWPRVVEEGPSRYGPTAAKWIRVNEEWSLGELLSQPDHVAPGIPVMFVLAKGTPFKQQFLEGEVPLF